MDLPGAGYLLGLGEIAMTFVGFSSLIMVFRQTAGGRLSRLDSWITLIFVQLGFIVMAGALAPGVLSLCGWSPLTVWRVSSAAIALLISSFAITYPARRHAVSGVAAPIYVWIDLALVALLCRHPIRQRGWPTLGAWSGRVRARAGWHSLRIRPGLFERPGALHRQT